MAQRPGSKTEPRDHWFETQNLKVFHVAAVFDYLMFSATLKHFKPNLTLSAFGVTGGTRVLNERTWGR